MSDIFSGLNDLGFENIGSVELYEKSKEEEIQAEQKEAAEKSIQKELLSLYDKKVTCPICGNNFSVKAVKTSSYRMKDKDSDFFIRYDVVNPYFYDVWLCDSCGYAAMKADFEKVKSFQKDLIKQNITSKWRGRTYSEPYSIDTAIERYKLSLLNYFFMQSPASKKAMNCLKLAWMYRLLEDTKTERDYLEQSLKGFNDAYFNEDFPIYGMDKFTTMYLIGELNRRIDKNDDALLWFSRVITAPGVGKRLKELARDQKDLIKTSSSKEEELEEISTSDANEKKGFFSSIFNK